MPLNAAEAGSVAVGAADGREEPSSLLDVLRLLRVGRRDDDRRRQGGDVGDQGVAFRLGQVESPGLGIGVEERGGLVVAGDLEAQLAGAGGQDKLAEGADLRFQPNRPI